MGLEAARDPWGIRRCFLRGIGHDFLEEHGLESISTNMTGAQDARGLPCLANINDGGLYAHLGWSPFKHVHLEVRAYKFLKYMLGLRGGNMTEAVGRRCYNPGPRPCQMGKGLKQLSGNGMRWAANGHGILPPSHQR